MFDNKKQILQDEYKYKQQPLREFKKTNYDEDDDIILPDTHWGEILLIYYMLIDIIKGPDKKKKLGILSRQIKFYKR